MEGLFAPIARSISAGPVGRLCSPSSASRWLLQWCVRMPIARTVMARLPGKSISGRASSQEESIEPAMSVSRCIAKRAILASEDLHCFSEGQLNCEGTLQSAQSHCRGQGFDSPQLRQPIQTNAPIPIRNPAVCRSSAGTKDMTQLSGIECCTAAGKSFNGRILRCPSPRSIQ